MRALVLVMLVVGCYHPEVAPGAPCATDLDCPSGLECRAGTCERPGSPTIDAADVDAPPIDACATPDTCSGDELVSCTGSITCDLGCSETGGAHCQQLAPSNGLDPDLLDGATADVTGAWNFYTDDGEIRKGNVTLRAAGSGVKAGIGFSIIDGMAVWRANSFAVPANETWTAIGDNTIVLFARTSIVVAGTIDVGATGADGVAGGSDANGSTSSASGCRGRAGRALGAGLGEGGGGGGGRGVGGAGGASNASGATGAGGSSCTSVASTTPLRGGAAGGHGAASSANHGGGGGGAIALVAMESVTITGIVGAPGAGGDAGPGPSPSGDAGGGGGGGGAVFVEAPLVMISGIATANGGAGAGPGPGTDGNRGNLASASTASGGSFTGPGGTAAGGRGGAGSSNPTAGGNYAFDDGLMTPTSVVSRGGGGGGSAGRIHVRSIAFTGSGSLFSPPATSDTAVLR